MIRKYLPSDESLREHTLLRPVRHLLQRPEIWHLHRRSVAGACFVGGFVAFIPLPLQMLIAAGFAIIGRVNLPISVALVWMTNPLTIPPMFYFAYSLGGWLLGIDPTIHGAGEMSWEWIREQAWLVLKPLLVGSLVCGWVTGLTLMVVARIAWRMHVVRRWRQRQESRHAKAAAARQVS